MNLNNFARKKYQKYRASRPEPPQLRIRYFLKLSLTLILTREAGKVSVCKSPLAPETDSSRVNFLGLRVTANSGFLTPSVILKIFHDALGILRVFSVHMKLNSCGKPVGNTSL